MTPKTLNFFSCVCSFRSFSLTLCQEIQKRKDEASGDENEAFPPTFVEESKKND